MAERLVPAYNNDMETSLSAAIGGIDHAFAVNAQRAQRIAKSSPGDNTFVRDMAELPSDANAVKANTAVIRTQDQMTGSLLDMFA
jgi:hypothetical protein